MGSASDGIQLHLIKGKGIRKHTASIMYMDIKNEAIFLLSLCARYSVTQLVKLSDSILAQSKEQPSATECIRGTH
jgi:hypothetical protein